jgi:hypothetical protein
MIAVALLPTQISVDHAICFFSTDGLLEKYPTSVGFAQNGRFFITKNVRPSVPKDVFQYPFVRIHTVR